uniref:Aminopeptidase n=2 Tax=Mesocestoides corti TaxID=53468 RepID=A0A5K3F2T3_MESCO
MAAPDLHFERLPTTYEVKEYKLDFLPNATDFTFHGNATISMHLAQSTNQFILNAKKLEILSAKIRHSTAKSDNTASSKSIEYDEKQERVTINFGSLLPEGDAELCLDYKGILDDNMQGFYRSAYNDEGGKKRIVLATQFEPTYARMAFPCADEPSRKAKFTISLVIQDHLTALSCMPEVSREALDDPPKYLPAPKNGRKYVRVSFAQTPVMSTYIFAFVVGHFDFCEAIDANNVLIRVYTPPGRSQLGHHALHVAKSALPFYTDLFGIGYPLPKLDLIAIPDFAMGAMENWGLLTYRETALLIDEAQSSLQSKRYVALVVAHEVAHMWFGNLVTMEWWTHLWLNEGFATWIEYLAVDHCFPEFDIWSIFLPSQFYAAMETDELRTSHPIEVVVNSPDEVEEIFDAVSYEKGSSIIRMINDYLGPETFNKGLQLYINRHKFSNTMTEDLWKALSEVSGEDVKSIMSTWTKQIGFPVLTVRPVSFDANKGLTISIDQTRFLIDGSQDDKALEWYVPVTICEASDSTKVLARVMVPPRGGVTSKDPFTVCIPPTAGKGQPKIRLNPGVFGFYRVQYDEGMMGPVLEALGEKQLPSLDRLSLLADTFALARAGRVRLTTALTMASTFLGEGDYTVWRELSTQLAFIRDIISESCYVKSVDAAGAPSTPVEVAMDMFMAHVAEDTFKRLGWDPRANESNNDTLLRPLLVAILGGTGSTEVVPEAQKRFEKHYRAVMAGQDGDGAAPRSDLIPADLRSAVYSTCIKHGGEEVYEQLLQLHDKATMQDERVRILHCIGLARKATVIKRAVDLAFSDFVRKQDRLRPLIALSGSPAGRRAVWSEVKTRIATVMDDLGGSHLAGRVLKSCCEGFCSKANYAEIDAFFKEHPVPCTRAVQQALETIGVNEGILQREEDQVKLYLTQFAENIPE